MLLKMHLDLEKLTMAHYMPSHGPEHKQPHPGKRTLASREARVRSSSRRASPSALARSRTRYASSSASGPLAPAANNGEGLGIRERAGAQLHLVRLLVRQRALGACGNQW